MSLSDVLSALQFWTGPSSWSLGAVGVSAPGVMSSADQTVVTNWISSLYSSSSTAAGFLNNLAQAGDIRIGKGGFGFYPSFNGSDKFIALDIDYFPKLLVFNANGDIRELDPRIIMMHELHHYVYGYSDPAGSSSLQQPTDQQMNASGFDIQGDAVRFETSVAQELGLSDQVRPSYWGTLWEGGDAREDEAYDASVLTSGHHFDIVRLGDRFAVGDVDNIDITARAGGESLWAMGFGGNDTIKGNDGADYLFGGKGKDVIVGGSGNDYLDGGSEADTLTGGDGVDQLHGGGGNDNLIDSAESAGTIFDGGADDDHYQYNVKDFASIDTSGLITFGRVDNKASIVFGASSGHDTFQTDADFGNRDFQSFIGLDDLSIADVSSDGLSLSWNPIVVGDSDGYQSTGDLYKGDLTITITSTGASLTIKDAWGQQLINALPDGPMTVGPIVPFGSFTLQDGKHFAAEYFV